MDLNKAHAKELEKRKKERKKELSNFHRIYAEKRKRQEHKYIVEVLKMVEAMKEDKEYYKTLLKEEQDNQEKQLKRQDAQYMELMQKGLLVVALQEKTKYEILLNKQELQHAKLGCILRR